MTEIQTPHTALLNLADMVDFLDSNIELLALTQTVQYEDLTPQAWETFKLALADVQSYFEYMKESSKYTASVFADEAALAHLTTVALAP